MGEIAQDKLKTYHSKKAEADALKGEIDGLRQELIDFHGLGDVPEEGPFGLEISSYTEERVSSKKLLEAVAKELGEEKAKNLRAECVSTIPKTRVDVFLKEERDKKKAKGKGKKNKAPAVTGAKDKEQDPDKQDAQAT